MLFLIWFIGLIIVGYLGAKLQGEAHYGVIPAALAALWTIGCIGFAIFGWVGVIPAVTLLIIGFIWAMVGLYG